MLVTSRACKKLDEFGVQIETHVRRRARRSKLDMRRPGCDRLASTVKGGRENEMPILHSMRNMQEVSRRCNSVAGDDPWHVLWYTLRRSATMQVHTTCVCSERWGAGAGLRRPPRAAHWLGRASLTGASHRLCKGVMPILFYAGICHFVFQWVWPRDSFWSRPHYWCLTQSGSRCCSMASSRHGFVACPFVWGVRCGDALGAMITGRNTPRARRGACW